LHCTGTANDGISAQASRDPSSFRDVATRLNVDPTPNTGSVRSVQDTLGALGIARLVLVAVLTPTALLALYLAATMITVRLQSPQPPPQPHSRPLTLALTLNLTRQPLTLSRSLCHAATTVSSC
jgi:hypothetical protein